MRFKLWCFSPGTDTGWRIFQEFNAWNAMIFLVSQP